jgi:hypothetical protein
VLLDAPLPRIVKPLDTVGRKNQVQIERAISELDEDLTPPDLLLLLLGQPPSSKRMAPDLPKNRYFTP